MLHLKNCWQFLHVKFNTVVKLFLLAGLRSYQLLLSPILGGNCRFYPSCSHYAVEALQKHSILDAVLLSFNRLRKCHPGSTFGYDPVPEIQNETAK